jgi:hypothetical protein
MCLHRAGRPSSACSTSGGVMSKNAIYRRRSTGPRGPWKKKPVALWSPKPILPYRFFTVCSGRSAPLLNLRQDQTRFWLHMGFRCPQARTNGMLARAAGTCAHPTSVRPNSSS